MTPNFYNAFVLFIDVVSLGATLQKECCPIKSNERGKSAARRVSSSRSVVIRDLSLFKRTATTKTDSRLGPSGMTAKHIVFVVVFCLFTVKGLFRFFFLLKF